MIRVMMIRIMMMMMRRRMVMTVMMMVMHGRFRSFIYQWSQNRERCESYQTGVVVVVVAVVVVVVAAAAAAAIIIMSCAWFSKIKSLLVRAPTNDAKSPGGGCKRGPCQLDHSWEDGQGGVFKLFRLSTSTGRLFLVSCLLAARGS